MGDPQESFYALAPDLVESEVADDGTIAFADRRFVFFHTEMFADLFERMEEVAGPVISRQVADFGFEAGQEIASKLDREFRSVGLLEFLRLLVRTGFDLRNLLALRPTTPEDQINKIFGYGRFIGWNGPTEIEFGEDRAVFTSPDETFESSSYGETGQTECTFMTGVVKGICAYFWDVDGEELEAEHPSCRCNGDGEEKIMVTRSDGTM